MILELQNTNLDNIWNKKHYWVGQKNWERMLIPQLISVYMLSSLSAVVGHFVTNGPPCEVES